MREPISDIDTLASMLATKIARKRAVIGIDGTEGVGKTTLAGELGARLSARVVSLDDHLEKKKGAYVPWLRVAEIRDAAASSEAHVILEGVCLRTAAARCNIEVDFHVYVRRIGANGLWYDEDVCLTLEPVEVLKERDRGLRAMAEQWAERGPSKSDTPEIADAGPGLAEELIDYHATFNPIEHADIIFDVVEKH